MSMRKTLANISKRDENSRSVIENQEFVLTADCENDFYKERLPTIPAGTVIVADFAGDFGMYGMAEIDGVLHKIKIELHELHKVNFGSFDARN